MVLAHDFPANVNDDTTAALVVQAFMVKDIEIPVRSLTANTYNFSAGATQLSVKAAITVKDPEWTSSGVEVAIPLMSPAGFGNISQLYVQYRAWAAQGSGIISLAATDDLDSFLPGPVDPDNPLKYAVSIARGAAGSQPISFFVVGNPVPTTGWQAALTLASRVRRTYGHAPLTSNPDVLDLVFAHVQLMNGADVNYYRVLWKGIPELTGKVVVDATLTANDQLALAVVEDNPNATGTQYTQVRITSGNADLLALGVRPGDTVRFQFESNDWGDETYVTRTVDSVVSATTLIVTEPFSAGEVVAKRVEVHRVYNSAELKDAYVEKINDHAADTVRAIIAPKVHIGSNVLPSYFASAIMAATRSAIPAQQTMSGYAIGQIANITGLELFSETDLAELSGYGATVINYDQQTATVIAYRAVTCTGDMLILAKREESMVSARHANLFAIVDRLRVYAGNSNLSDDAALSSDLSNMILAELSSVKKELQSKNYTPALLGQLIDLTNIVIAPSATMEDVLDISGTMILGRPTNRIDFNVLIQ